MMTASDSARRTHEATMRLTQFTDNALRCLMLLALRAGGAVPIPEIARTMEISEDHLAKIVQRLVRLGYVQTSRGRLGGVRLARDPAEINLGQLVRVTEKHFDPVACCGDCAVDCPIAPACSIGPVFSDALTAFLAVLDGRTLESVIVRRAVERRELMASVG
jgi:Rrf2 family transcriptional regulator, nitric oxide-sensitive transcriptional repressor